MTGRPIATALALLLFSGCAGPPGGYSIVGPLPEPPPPTPEPETFEGRDALKSRIEAAGGFEGMVALFDGEDSDHGRFMRQTLIDEGVPPERIAFPDTTHVTDIAQLEEERNADLLARTRVAHVPFLAPLRHDDEPETIGAHNIVWSIAAGNTHQPGVGGDRDLWRPDHPFWVEQREPGSNCCANAWENHVKAFATGKALIATYAHADGEGSYAWDEYLVSCGEMRDACFAIEQPPDERGGTSDASAKLAAAAFYVFQLYEKAEEVVDTLKECAEDIGEPGVDYEFGLGLVSLACERVESAEVLTASSSLVLRWDAPALEALLGSRRSAGLRVRASRWIADRDGLPLARLPTRLPARAGGCSGRTAVTCGRCSPSAAAAARCRRGHPGRAWRGARRPARGAGPPTRAARG